MSDYSEAQAWEQAQVFWSGLKNGFVLALLTMGIALVGLSCIWGGKTRTLPPAKVGAPTGQASKIVNNAKKAIEAAVPQMEKTREAITMGKTLVLSGSGTVEVVKQLDTAALSNGLALQNVRLADTNLASAQTIFVSLVPAAVAIDKDSEATRSKIADLQKQVDEKNNRFYNFCYMVFGLLFIGGILVMVFVKDFKLGGSLLGAGILGFGIIRFIQSNEKIFMWGVGLLMLAGMAASGYALWRYFTHNQALRENVQLTESLKSHLPADVRHNYFGTTKTDVPKAHAFQSNQTIKLVDKLRREAKISSP